MTFATITFGLASYFSTAWIFFTVSLLARFFQGMAQAATTCTNMSIIAAEFKNDRPKYISYINMSLGLGLALGPVLGSLVYSFLNYRGTFYFFAAYIFFIGTVCVSLVPKRLNG